MVAVGQEIRPVLIVVKALIDLFMAKDRKERDMDDFNSIMDIAGDVLTRDKDAYEEYISRLGMLVLVKRDLFEPLYIREFLINLPFHAGHEAHLTFI